jgi:hypothetical protein
MSGNTSAGGALARHVRRRAGGRQLFPLPFFVAGIYVGALVVRRLPQARIDATPRSGRRVRAE